MRVMIVEDEYYSRKMLVKLLREMELELDICAQAESGRQAVEYLKREPVDLVITDINMPDMDGLELAEYVAKNFPDTKVVIESGYADFHYAQQAIRFGVRNYLTKPVKPEELKQTLRELIGENREAFRYLSIPLITETPALMRHFAARCGGMPDHASCRMFLFQGREQPEEKPADACCQQISRIFSHYRAVDFYFQRQDELVILVFGDEAELNKAAALPALYQQTKEKRLGCGLSRIYQGVGEIGKAYRDCVCAMNCRLLQADQSVFAYPAKTNAVSLLKESEELLLDESLQKHHIAQAEAVVQAFFGRCRQGQGDVYALYRGIIRIFSAVSRAYDKREMEGTDHEANRHFLFSFNSDLYQFRSLDRLEAYVSGMLSHACRPSFGQAENQIIGEIKDYVARNYRYDISFKELAAHKYFMNPSYLSRLFKARTGMNFSKYLIEYRMERARELLEHTEFKINEIADCVGYNDTSYFIHTFRKQYQMTPEQYRLREKN